MGYSKYTEDIEKIRSLNIFGTFLDFQVRPVTPSHKCPFCSFETQAKDQFEAHLFSQHRNAAVFLEYDGHIIPESIAFSVRPVHLKIRCLALPDGVEVRTQSSAPRKSSRRCKDGDLLAITPPDEEIVTITLAVGPYKRDYGVTFKKKILTARLTKHLVTQVELANSQMPAWQWSDAHQFEADLLREPGLTADEKTHRLAIFEYYFGLWLEGKTAPEYPRHLERAFEVLRDFDEPLAHLISSYFLYRTNAFESIQAKLPFPRLRRVTAFFLDANSSPSPSSASQGLELMPCEIAIADADHALFEAVAAYDSSDYQEAHRLAETAESRRTQNDDQASHRITLVRLRAAASLGNKAEARSLAEPLARCGVTPFRREAESFLKNRS